MDSLLASSTGNISELNDWEAVEVFDLDVVDSLFSLAVLDIGLRLIDPLLASAGNKSEFNDGLDADLRLVDPLLASSTGNISEFNDWEAAEAFDLDVVDSLFSLAVLDIDLRLIDPLLASAGNISEFNDDWEAAELLAFDLVASLLAFDLVASLLPELVGRDPDLRLMDPLLASRLAGNNNEFIDWKASGVTAPSLADFEPANSDPSDDLAVDSSPRGWLVCDCLSCNSFFPMDLDLRRLLNRV